jgi:hypothetical protein
MMVISRSRPRTGETRRLVGRDAVNRIFAVARQWDADIADAVAPVASTTMSYRGPGRLGSRWLLTGSVREIWMSGRPGRAPDRADWVGAATVTDAAPPDDQLGKQRPRQPGAEASGRPGQMWGAQAVRRTQRAP